jgi:hypothetical protein
VTNSLYNNVIALLFDIHKNGTKTLYFLVAEDTYVSPGATLELSMMIDSCKIKPNMKKAGNEISPGL